MGSHNAKERRPVLSPEIWERICHFSRLCTDATIIGVFVVVVILVGRATEQGVVFATTINMPWHHEQEH